MTFDSIRGALSLGVILCASLAGAQQPAAADFFVATDGNDEWSGKLAAPNAERSDGPFASVGRAQQAVRELRRKSQPSRPTIVLVRGGTYRLDRPLLFGPEDSGTAAAPVVYAAYPAERPIFSGGVVLSGWKKSTGGLWTTEVPAVREGKWYFRQLFVGGTRRDPARSPNAGAVLRTQGPLEPLKDRTAARKDADAKMGFRFKPGDLEAWPDKEDAILVVYHSWTTSRHHVAEIDVQQKAVRFSAPSGWPLGYWEKNQRYYVENVRAALDAPGEWHLDRKAGVVTYWPMENEDLSKTDVVAGRIGELVRIVGEPEKGRFVEHLVLRGLSFQHADWSLGRTESCDGQAAAFLQSAALFARGARQCTFDTCNVSHVGGYALWLERGCQHNRITGCDLYDLGAGGVRIGTTDLPSDPALQAEHNLVERSRIHQGGRVYHAGVGVWIGKSSHNTIRQNEIFDLYYTGISVGWSWGYAPSSAHHNLIEYNHVYQIGQEQLSDMGGIYTLGVSPGTRIHHNVFHDVRSYSYGGWGIYPDEGSTEILIENNLAYRTKTGGFHQHYGKENVVRNNIFAFADEGQIIRSRQEPHRSFTFERNIVFFSQGTLFGSNWNDGNFRLDHNVYWRTDQKPVVFPGNRAFADWQKTGQDVHSVIADPKFVAAEKGDFRLQADSPAVRLGFQPIDFTGVPSLPAPAR